MKKEFSQKQFLYQALNKFIPAVRHLASACLCDYFKRKKKSMQTLGYFYA